MMRRATSVCAMQYLRVALGSVAGAWSFSTAAAQPSLPDGFAVQTVTLGPFVSQPTGFAFLPDGRLLVTERATGYVHLVPTTSTVSAVIDTIPNVTSTGERGLLGVAVDPGWPARPYVYFHSTQVGSVIHITMVTASGDLVNPASTSLSLGNPYVLLDDIPDLASTHNGGTLRFGPDGYLYASVGDDVRACEAQNLDSPRGKILRLDVSQMPGAGPGPPPRLDLAPAGHPYAGSGWQPLVHALGLRNPFRFTIDPASGNLYIGDVGELTWEEIDELVQAGYTGNNFGWPEFEGPLQDPLPAAADCSTPPFVDPIHVEPNPPGAAAIICGPLYRTSATAPYAFPRAYDGDLFYVDFYAGWMRRLVNTGGSWALADSVPGQPSAANWGADFSQISDLQLGPDGALYYISFTSGSTPQGVHRIVNTLPSDVGERNHTPLLARVVPNPASLRLGVNIRFEVAPAHPTDIRIFDVTGRLVCTLAPSSTATLHWDGRSQDGHLAGAGLYFYRARTPRGEHTHGKLVLLE